MQLIKTRTDPRFCEDCTNDKKFCDSCHRASNYIPYNDDSEIEAPSKEEK